MEISSRLDHLESVAEWVARETVHADSGVSQTGTLICVLADEIRESIYELAKSLEEAPEKEPKEPSIIEELEEETIH